MASASLRRFVLFRGFSTAAPAPAAAAPHAEHAGGIRLWKILSFSVAIPGVLLCYANARTKEAEHHQHHVRPEFLPYDHLRRRTKKFPWGDGNHSLFHNPETNPLPTGYEDE